MITTTNRPTLLLSEGQRVYDLCLFRKGTVKRHNARTERYMLELDYWEGQRLHEKYVYRSRDQIVKTVR